MDLSPTTQANSEQVNAEDLIAGPRTVTITGVKKGTADQPVFIDLAEFPGRTFRPAKSVRRVLVAAWGPDSSAYIGRKLTIFNDPTVRWAGQEVGGVRISAMSHIDKPLTVALTVSRGKRAPFTVQPLADGTQVLEAVLNDIQNATSIPALKTAWDVAGTRKMQGHPDVIAATNKRKAELGKDE